MHSNTSTSARSASLLQPGGDSLASPPHHIERIDAPVDRTEVLRYLGYPAGTPPSTNAQSVLDAAIPQAAALAQSQAVYAVFPVLSISKRRVRLAAPSGEIEFQGAIGEFLGPVNWVAAFIATAGPHIGHRARELQAAGDLLEGLIYDAVGSERAEAAEAEVISQLRGQLGPRGMALTLPYSPGYCGMALTEQNNLFALFAGQTASVTLTPLCQMQPIKSVSGLIGIGQTENVQQWGSPCDRCEHWTCNMRR